MAGTDGRTRWNVGRLRAAALVGLVALVGPLPALTAQTAPPATAGAAREFKSVSAAEAHIRCAGGTYYYPIARVRANDVLVSLGKEGEWVRVEYPTGTFAYVGAEDAEKRDANVALTAPSRLKAANLNYGLRGSWKAVYDEPLPVGTTLRLIEPVADEGGQTTAFLVEAPAGAIGYIHESSIRDATPEEIAKFKASMVPMPKGETTANAQGAGQAGPNAAEAQHAPTGENATAPVAEAGDATPDQGESAPGETGLRANEQVVSIDQSQHQTAPSGPDAQFMATAAALDAAFREVYAQPVIDAEYDELIAELKRAGESIPGTSSDVELFKRRIEQRVAVLELKRDVQKEQRALAEATRKIDEGAARLAEQLAALEKSQSYSIVGRLVPSTVYDGSRLPLMYRIQSVGHAVPRTLGYVRPNEGVDIKSKVGEVVGVIGQSSLDLSLKLRVIRPERIDVLAPATSAAPTVTADVPEEPEKDG
jgi:hypothetical protein